MNIIFDTDISNKSNSYTGQVSSRDNRSLMENEGLSVQASAFALSIGDNNRFMGMADTDRKNIDDFQNYLSETDVQMKQDYMSVMSLSMSDEDYAQFVKNGEVPEDMDPADAVTILDEIKAELIKAGTVVNGYTDDINMDTLSQIMGSEAAAGELISSMYAKDIPVTEDTVNSAVEAFNKLNEALPLSEESLNYLLINQKTPTVDNLYNAAHSGSESGMNYVGAPKIDSVDFDSLRPQIEELIDKCGIEDSRQALEDAQWMLERNIPITTENIYKLDKLHEFSENVSDTEKINVITNAMCAGIPAGKANVLHSSTIYELADKYIEELNSIPDEVVDRVASEGKEFNLINLVKAANQNVSDENISMNIHNRRILEEARISMTVEANRLLCRSNFYIDITPMEDLVKALKQAEESIGNNLFPAQKQEETSEQTQIFFQARYEIASIPSMPAAVLGELEGQFTLHQVYTLGKQKAEIYETAQLRYEEIMTAPRANMGDSLRKAFRNIPSLLSELGLDNDEDNSRAVRILGANELEITPENIERIKESDAALRNALDRLSPGRVLEMIREKVNPLTMSVTQLNDYLDNKDSEPEKQAENYARFLMQLERQNEITELERESYIGIYRMLNKLDKSDDAALGRLMEMGQEINMGNLLQAMRSMNHKRMDYKVDDTFGGIDSIRNNPAIDEQINASFVEHIIDSGDALSFSSLEAMQTLRNKRGDWFGPLKDASLTDSEDASARVEAFLDKMESMEAPMQTYGNMLDDFSSRLHEMIMEADSYIDVKTMQSSIKQISILKSMVRDESMDIPVSIDGESTSIRLTIKHQSGAGQLFISMETEGLGQIAAQFSWQGSGSGYIAYEKEDISGRLQQVAELMGERLSFAPELIKVDKINPDKYGMSPVWSKKKSDMIKDKEEKADISSTELYRISKIFIQAIAGKEASR